MKKFLFAALFGLTVCAVYAVPIDRDNDAKIIYSIDDNYDIVITVIENAAPVAIDYVTIEALSTDDGNDVVSLAILETSFVLPETTDYRQRFWRNQNIGEPLLGFKSDINKIPLITHNHKVEPRHLRLC